MISCGDHTRSRLTSHPSPFVPSDSAPSGEMKSNPLIGQTKKILRQPGTFRIYRPGDHAPGTRLKFTDTIYEVQANGSLRRA
jgi:hypothetical protein